VKPEEAFNENAVPFLNAFTALSVIRIIAR